MTARSRNKFQPQLINEYNVIKKESKRRVVGFEELKDVYLPHASNRTHLQDLLQISKHTFVSRYSSMMVEEEGISVLQWVKDYFKDVGVRQRPKEEVKIIRELDVAYSAYDIITGIVRPNVYNYNDIADSLIKENLLPDCCNRCGFNNRRIANYKVPLILINNNDEANNFTLKNLELICYNCYYIEVGDIFKDSRAHEDLSRDLGRVSLLKQDLNYDKFVDIDTYHIERLSKLGVIDNIDQLPKKKKDDDDPYNLVSYKF